MRAAILESYGDPLSIEAVAEPELAPHGIVVEVEACGICRSDWHAWRGHGEWADDRVERGQILGHEPAGRVTSVGEDVDRLEVGDSVAVPFNLGDGTCAQCRSGHGNVCADGFALGFESSVPGAFAEVVASDGGRERLLDDRTGQPANEGADVSVDALGRAETCRNSLDSLRIRGTHVQLGLTTAAERGEVSLPVDEITRWDVDFLGTRGMPPSRYDEILRMIAAGRLDPGRLVTKTVALEDVSDRLAAMTDYETRGIEVVTEF